MDGDARAQQANGIRYCSPFDLVASPPARDYSLLNEADRIG
jgi:hypothetical protein